MILNDLKETFNGSSACFIWPHHFDQAITFTLKETGDPATNTNVSAGFSPGDSFYDEPYFYVNSWPYVDTSYIEKSKMGKPHTDEWVGKVLFISDVLKADNEYELLHEFYRSNISHISAFLLK
jgi:hypothetical protein